MKKSIKKLVIWSQIIGLSALGAVACTDNQEPVTNQKHVTKESTKPDSNTNQSDSTKNMNSESDGASDRNQSMTEDNSIKNTISGTEGKTTTEVSDKSNDGLKNMQSDPPTGPSGSNAISTIPGHTPPEMKKSEKPQGTGEQEHRTESLTQSGPTMSPMKQTPPSTPPHEEGQPNNGSTGNPEMTQVPQEETGEPKGPTNTPTEPKAPQSTENGPDHMKATTSEHS